jgi:glycosylphosphatidylinositol transamidase
MVGLLCAPLSFVKRINPQTKAALRYPIAILGLLALNVLSPPAVLIGACWFSGVSVEVVLTQAAFGWNVWGMWTQVVVWCVWWPAWVVGCVLLGSSVL